ncbi:unnamed protein product [Spirodela intermedia]|uniref:Uncharacterized protein n=2 Tax=Spirodela intermedia TaxID=51605 RepID=A0ABN7E7N1_SPIIN|nr:unnamed protein product [Spirodela intermedia]CAA7405894.1 unnamed protein product [Spirodela intermedia]
MRQRCTRILNVRENGRIMYIPSKALFRQRQC